MTMSATSMATRIESFMGAVAASQGQSATTANAYRNQMLIALCQGIIAEIQADAVVTTTDAQGGTNTGTVA